MPPANTVWLSSQLQNSGFFERSLATFLNSARMLNGVRATTMFRASGVKLPSAKSSMKEISRAFDNSGSAFGSVCATNRIARSTYQALPEWHASSTVTRNVATSQCNSPFSQSSIASKLHGIHGEAPQGTRLYRLLFLTRRLVCSWCHEPTVSALWLARCLYLAPSDPAPHRCREKVLDAAGRVTKK